jgi:hypothetical protein
MINWSQLKQHKEDTYDDVPKPKKLRQSVTTLINNANTEITTKDISQALFMKFYNHRYSISNAYIFNWESDYLTVTDSDYVIEIESKVSRSDFKDDFKKVEKHALLEAESCDNSLRPNKLYYCTPRGLLGTWELPKHAGLIEVHRDKNGELVCTTVREAKFIHKDSILNSIKDTLLLKFSWRIKEMLLRNYENYMEILPGEENSVDL